MGRDSVVLKGGFPLHVARCHVIMGTGAIFEDDHGVERWQQKERMKHPPTRELYLSV